MNLELLKNPELKLHMSQVCNLVVKLSEVYLTFHEGMQNEIVLQQVMNTINNCSVNNIISYLIIS